MKAFAEPKWVLLEPGAPLPTSGQHTLVVNCSETESEDGNTDQSFTIVTVDEPAKRNAVDIGSILPPDPSKFQRTKSKSGYDVVICPGMPGSIFATTVGGGELTDGDILHLLGGGIVSFPPGSLKFKKGPNEYNTRFKIGVRDYQGKTYASTVFADRDDDAPEILHGQNDSPAASGRVGTTRASNKGEATVEYTND